jgi:hypothetical protein
MEKEIQRLIKISTLRDVQTELVRKQLDNLIIPEVVFEIIKNLEDQYNKEYNESSKS